MGLNNHCQCVPSAFRALLDTDQTVQANTAPAPIRYTNEQFDLNDEYDLIAFTPEQDGVYSIEASALFNPDNINVTAFLFLTIRVNDVQVASTSEVFVPVTGALVNSVSVSTISQLNAGDRVEVFFSSNQSGTIFRSSPITQVGSALQAARFPSPTN